MKSLTIINHGESSGSLRPVERGAGCPSVLQHIVKSGIGYGEACPGHIRRRFLAILFNINDKFEVSGKAALEAAAEHLEGRRQPEPHGGVGVKLAAEIADRIKTPLDDLLDFRNARLELGRNIEAQQIQREAGSRQTTGDVVMQNAGEALALTAARLQDCDERNRAVSHACE